MLFLCKLSSLKNVLDSNWGYLHGAVISLLMSTIKEGYLCVLFFFFFLTWTLNLYVCTITNFPHANCGQHECTLCKWTTLLYLNHWHPCQTSQGIKCTQQGFVRKREYLVLFQPTHCFAKGTTRSLKSVLNRSSLHRWERAKEWCFLILIRLLPP